MNLVYSDNSYAGFEEQLADETVCIDLSDGTVREGLKIRINGNSVSRTANESDRRLNW